MKALILICLFIFSIYFFSYGQNEISDNYVPDSITAIKIAEAVWLPRFGKDIYKKKPFVATLKNDSIWVVKGSLHHKKGGVPYAEIQKYDGRIRSIYHTK